MNARETFDVETEYLNLVVEDESFSVRVAVAVSQAIRFGLFDLCDVLYVCAQGRVTSVDMIEDRGLWRAHGWSLDGYELVIDVAINASRCEIELLYVFVVGKREAE